MRFVHKTVSYVSSVPGQEFLKHQREPPERQAVIRNSLLTIIWYYGYYVSSLKHQYGRYTSMVHVGNMNQRDEKGTCSVPDKGVGLLLLESVRYRNFFLLRPSTWCIGSNSTLQETASSTIITGMYQPVVRQKIGSVPLTQQKQLPGRAQ